MKRLAALALFCGILSLNSGSAQDRKTTPRDPAPAKPQRALYTVHHGDATVLAEVVGRHFKGEAEVIAAPAGSGNAVLVCGAKETVTEVLTLLDQLDKKPRTIEVEVTIAEVPAPKDGKDVTPGEVKTGQRITLTAAEGQPVTSQTGGDKPFVSGSAVAGGFGKGGGVAQKSINYRPVGTTVKMAARVGSDDTVALELSVQDSRVRPAEAGDESGAAALETATLNTKLSVPAGKAVVAQAVRTEGKNGATVTVVIVTARVVPDAARRP